MKIIALGQQKGGVGKSCVAIHLACQAMARKKRAAIIDMDAEQFTAWHWGQRRDAGPPIVHKANVRTLEPLLGQLKRDAIEWAFIDLPGRSASDANLGLARSDFVIIPCRPIGIDIEASKETRLGLKRAGKPYAYLLNIVSPQPNCPRAKEWAEALKNGEHSVIPIYVTKRVAIPDAIESGKGIIEYAPKSPSAEEFRKLFAWIEKEVR
jgi:chromosome partitioning protein